MRRIREEELEPGGCKKQINKIKMRNRSLMQKKVEYLESTLINLQRIVKTQEPIEVYIQNIEKGLEVIEDLKSMIEAEPMSPNEVNRF
jgi:hypothetical protein